MVAAGPGSAGSPLEASPNDQFPAVLEDPFFMNGVGFESRNERNRREFRLIHPSDPSAVCLWENRISAYPHDWGGEQAAWIWEA